jgi:hypothetical protein
MRIMRTSAGVVRNRSEQIHELRRTDFPDPVVPATTVAQPTVKKGKKTDKIEEEKPRETGSENVNPDDIPF